MSTSECFSKFIYTPILAFPQWGRGQAKRTCPVGKFSEGAGLQGRTFPPWGKMKGGKKLNKTEIIYYQKTEV